MSKVQIEMTDHGRGRIVVDGSELTNVRSISFKFAPKEPNVVTVELYAEQLDMAGVADVIQEGVVASDG